MDLKSCAVRLASAPDDTRRELGCKLIRIFVALLSKGVAYNPVKMMADIRRPQTFQKQAA